MDKEVIQMIQKQSRDDLLSFCVYTDKYFEVNRHHEIIAEIKVPEPRIADRVPCGRVNMKERPVEERSDDFELSELGMSNQEAMQESRRCLRCDHFGFGVFKGGRIERW